MPNNHWLFHDQLQDCKVFLSFKINTFPGLETLHRAPKRFIQTTRAQNDIFFGEF